MLLYDQIYKDMIDAKKARDEFKSAALSFIYSALKQYKIDARKQNESISDEEVQSVLTKAAKQRKDSIQMYENGGRAELAEKEKKELEILMGYLPEQMDSAAVDDFVKTEAAALKIASPKDVSKLMGAVMPKLKGRADGRLVSESVKKFVSSLAG